VVGKVFTHAEKRKSPSSRTKEKKTFTFLRARLDEIEMKKEEKT
jgi:hypothetical protein